MFRGDGQGQGLRRGRICRQNERQPGGLALQVAPQQARPLIRGLQQRVAWREQGGFGHDLLRLLAGLGEIGDRLLQGFFLHRAGQGRGAVFALRPDGQMQCSRVLQQPVFERTRQGGLQTACGHDRKCHGQDRGVQRIDHHHHPPAARQKRNLFAPFGLQLAVCAEQHILQRRQRVRGREWRQLKNQGLHGDADCREALLQ